MSLRPQDPLPPVLVGTARVALAAFPRGTLYFLPRDRLGAIFADADFADLYPFPRPFRLHGRLHC